METSRPKKIYCKKRNMKEHFVETDGNKTELAGNKFC